MPLEVVDSPSAVDQLSRPPLLVNLARRVQIASIEYDILTAEVLEDNLQGDLPGLIGEAHLLRVLKQVSAEEPDGTIVVDPISPTDETLKFRFEENARNNIVALDRTTGEQHAEYDAITRLRRETSTGKRVTVVWEIKTGGRPRKGGNNVDLRTALTPQAVNRKLGPVKEQFPDDQIGIVVVGLTGSISRHSGELANFRNRGGIYVDILTPHDRFQNNIAAVTFSRVA